MDLVSSCPGQDRLSRAQISEKVIKSSSFSAFQWHHVLFLFPVRCLFSCDAVAFVRAK